LLVSVWGFFEWCPVPVVCSEMGCCPFGAPYPIGPFIFSFGTLFGAPFFSVCQWCGFSAMADGFGSLPVLGVESPPFLLSEDGQMLLFLAIVAMLFWWVW